MADPVDAVSDLGLDRSKLSCIRWGPYAHGKGQFWG